MPASISYSSVPPKFPDKQRRPGIIQLPQPLPPQLSTHHKHNSLGSMPGPATSAVASVKQLFPKLQSQPQLRTPEPSPKRKPANPRSGSPQRRQTKPRRSEQVKAPAPTVTPSPPSPVAFELPAFEFPKRNNNKMVIDPAAGAPLSPPPTPAPDSRKKHRSNKPALSLAKLPRVPLASPPPSPTVYKSSQGTAAMSVPRAPVLLPAFDLSNQSLPLADDDEVILVPQGSSPPRRASPPPSPAAVREWETIKALPRLDAQTVAYLKETYQIQSSKPTEPTSVPSTPGIGAHSQSRPIPIARRPTAAHLRSPSLPLYPTSSRAAMAQMREEVAQVFDLDSEDVTAVAKAADAWRAYAGSTFNDSPEEESTMRAPAPRFLSRMFN